VRIEYHPAVEEELRQIRDYYNQSSPGLGDDFIAAFEKQVLEIAKQPGRWMIVVRDLRRCLMCRFPFIIYFRQVDPETIRITVVKHSRGHPNLGRDRF
jgi:toxin ParE1/3/4